MNLRKKILLIEDNKIAQRIPTLILESEGWNVDIADTGHRALNLLHNNFYDLIILDFGLPDFDGQTLAKIIRTILVNVPPVIGLTAHENVELIEGTAMNEVIQKPFSRDTYQYVFLKYFCSKSQFYDEVVGVKQA